MCVFFLVLKVTVNTLHKLNEILFLRHLVQTDFSLWPSPSWQFALASAGLWSASLLLNERAHRWVAPTVFLAASCMAMAFAMFDPYLNVWDEQFHAVVAKRLAQDPLEPRLFLRHFLENEPIGWPDCGVWLHKQPFFMWLMALSIKIFGTTYWAIRLPSVMLYGAMATATFGMGKMWVNARVGWLAALLLSMAHLPLEFLAGRAASDQNDVVFMALVTLSTGAWAKFNSTQMPRWALAVGALVGCAVLTKWLAGFLTLGCWFAVILFFRKWKQLKWWALALALAIAVALPWQLYTLVKFPDAAALEMAYNGRHLFEVIEGHGGDQWYHYDVIKQLYAPSRWMPIFLLIGLVVLAIRGTNRAAATFAVLAVVVVYAVFTFAATKMPGFTLMVMPLLLIGFASAIEWPFHYSSQKWTNSIRWSAAGFVALSVVLALWFLGPGRVNSLHGFDGKGYYAYQQYKTCEARYMQLFEVPAADSVVVLFNSIGHYYGNISFMYFRQFPAAYAHGPKPGDVDRVIASGHVPVVLVWPGQHIERDIRAHYIDVPELWHPDSGCVY